MKLVFVLQQYAKNKKIRNLVHTFQKNVLITHQKNTMDLV